MTFWTIQTLNALSLSMILFLLSSGLTVIFGLMRVVNLAHGSFYLLGGYIGISVIQATGSFWLALLVAPSCVAVLGGLMQRFLLRQLHDDELAQVLLTFGVLLVIADVSLWAWGGIPQLLPQPEILRGSIRYEGLVFPLYRLALTVAGIIAAIVIWLIFERSRIGAIVRAGVDDEEMVRGIGIPIGRIFTFVFASGAFLAAMAGVLSGAMLGVYPGADFQVLLLAFAVLVIGGIGSLLGAFIGSLLIGFVDTLGKALMPELALFTIFVPMVIMLAIRPTGLFGRT